MTDNAAQAAQLVRRAAENNVVLQVGHVERFNPVLHYLEEVATDPRFIETHRLSPYPARSMDIGVVLDLMIHDLDVVLALVRSPVASVDAVGIPVLSKTEDIANARLRFANGCVANLTASRVSPERMRKIRVFSAGAVASYISLDYRAQEGFLYRVAREGEEKSSFLKKLLRAKDSAIVSEFAGKNDRARTGAHRKRRAAQAGTAGFHPLHSIASDPESQRRHRQARPGSGPGNHPPDSGRQRQEMIEYRAGDSLLGGSPGVTINHAKHPLCLLAEWRCLARPSGRISGLYDPGTTLDDLKEHLLDLYKDLSSGAIPGVRKVAELEIP